MDLTLIHSILSIPNKFKYTILDDCINYDYISTHTKINYLISGTNIKFNDAKDDMLSQHIIRILMTQFNSNIFDINTMYDVLQFVVNTIVSPYIHCTICGKKNDYIDEKIGSCENSCENTEAEDKECFYKYCELVTDNIITDNINRDQLTVYFLVKTLVECVNSTRVEKVYNPRPNKYKTIDQIKYLKNLINKNNLIDKIKAISLPTNDFNICKIIGNELYGIVKYTILTNKTYIISEKLNANIFNEDGKEHMSLNRLLNFQVIHDNQDIEKRFRCVSDNPFYVFHGSDIGNWYSIMRNGLKNYSGTDMMVNGAAMGQGIYLAENASLAYGYSARGVTSKNMENIIILGVVQLLEKDKYNKGNGVYVVPDESNVLLKYLVLLSHGDIGKIESYYKLRAKELGNNTSKIINITLKRLTTEFDKLIKLKYDIKLKEENSFVWIITIANNIYEFTFDEKYPIHPPIIKIMTNNNGNITNFITKDNILKLKEFHENNWTIKNDVKYIIKTIDQHS